MSTTANEVQIRDDAVWNSFTARYGFGEWEATDWLTPPQKTERDAFRREHPEIETAVLLKNGCWRVSIAIPGEGKWPLIISAVGRGATLADAYEAAKIHFVTLSVRGH